MFVALESALDSKARAARRELLVRVSKYDAGVGVEFALI